MVVRSPHCPDTATLQSLLLGKLAIDEANRLEAHLTKCESCVLVAGTLPAHDEFTTALRTARVPVDDDELLEQMLSSVDVEETQVFNESATSSELCNAVGLPHKRRRDLPDREELAAMLHPSEHPDALGRLGSYRVLELIGAGGMGLVFRAEDERLHRTVALKAMRPAVAVRRRARARFLREARATARLDHHHIVHIYEVGQDRGVPFIAMQHLQGESLKARLLRDKHLEQSDVARIGRDVASGLSAAHSHGLIHRDVKPANVWLQRETGWATILDFGLARDDDEEDDLTEAGTVLGTPKYMAPEQARGEAVDARSDLFSLGSVLYHLTCGRAPFAEGSRTATLLAVAQAKCTPISEMCPGVHPRLACLIERLMSLAPDSRPATADEVAEELACIAKLPDVNASRFLETPWPDPVNSDVTANTDPIQRSAASRWDAGKCLRAVGIAVMLLATAAVGLWAAVTILRVQADNGELVIRVREDDFATSVRGKRVTLKNTKTDQTFVVTLESPDQSERLAPGEYRFDVSSNSGLRTKSNRFTIEKDQRLQVEVWWEPTSVGKDAADNTAGAEDAEWPDFGEDAPDFAIAPFDGEAAKQLQTNWARFLGVPAEFTTAQGMTFRLIPPGEFTMGTERPEFERLSFGMGQYITNHLRDEMPAHRVRVSPFYIGIAEVTADDFSNFVSATDYVTLAEKDGMGGVLYGGNVGQEKLSRKWNWRTPGFESSGQHPVVQLTLFDIVEFRQWLTRKTGLKHQLPTEAQWEFACRAGSDETQLPRATLLAEAWCMSSSATPMPVMSKRANAFGIYDMIGNVYEWTRDYYGPYRGGATQLDPVGPAEGEQRVVRGAAFYNNSTFARAAERYHHFESGRRNATGFRLCVSVEGVRKAVGSTKSSK